MLDINKKIDGTAMTVAVSGKLDSVTSADFEAAIKESIEPITDLTIDMDGLTYISSAGLRVLLSSQKIMNRQGSMKVVHVNDTVMEILDVTGFADILTIE